MYLQALSDHKVLLEGTLLKPNMVSAGQLLPHALLASSKNMSSRKHGRRAAGNWKIAKVVRTEFWPSACLQSLMPPCAGIDDKTASTLEIVALAMLALQKGGVAC